ncbi:L-aspartate oxidase [Oleomonas cavernae]|uniref:L-aspartate oxidase n=1 Tax=Oleomonas cavernae TaxID=2320859 RepID=A0A418WIV9_9PROT|nr:L-aspartate oxidase [Oleomonas cavernae]RJF89954.1 L-aspartate oxidase [Oleomonas cavernae]
MRQFQADIVVVGSGLAGLSAALALAPKRVVVVTKTDGIEGGSSLWAQGGIAAAIAQGDRAADHAADTMAAGDGLCDAIAVTNLTAAGPQAIASLREFGVPFDRDPATGDLSLGREGAHSRARVAHADGDRTGRAVVTTLAARLRATPSVTVMANAFATEILVSEGVVAGLLVHSATDGWVTIRTPKILLATGGLGALWARTTNPPEATGDGLALAARAGAALVDLEFMQFHPTALLVEGTEPLPLLTEALRGAGARLMKADGEPLLAGKHPQGDLAPRDVVARAIQGEIGAGCQVFLDLRPAIAAKGAEHFPQAIEICRAAGFDPFAQPVPVTPAAHYHMGGVLVDGYGRTRLPGLYACGEVAGTGVHGANRLASNSLLEAFVAGRRTALIMAQDRRVLPQALPNAALLKGSAVDAVAPLRQALRAIMMTDVGLVRAEAGLRRALEKFDGIAAAAAAAEARLDEAPTDHASIRAAGEMRNLLTIGRLVALAALSRTESRGAHARSDCPTTQDAWLRRQIVALDAAGARLETIGLVTPQRVAAE